MIVLVYGILSLFNYMICLSCLPAIHDILHTPMAQYSVFVLKVPLNTKQANKQTVIHGQCDFRPMVTFPATRHHRPLAITRLYCLVTEAHEWVVYH